MVRSWILHAESTCPCGRRPEGSQEIEAAALGAGQHGAGVLEGSEPQAIHGHLQSGDTGRVGSGSGPAKSTKPSGLQAAPLPAKRFAFCWL